jgi:hypothetical protein
MLQTGNIAVLHHDVIMEWLSSALKAHGFTKKPKVYTSGEHGLTGDSIAAEVVECDYTLSIAQFIDTGIPCADSSGFVGFKVCDIIAAAQTVNHLETKPYLFLEGGDYSVAITGMR